MRKREVWEPRQKHERQICCVELTRFPRKLGSSITCADIVWECDGGFSCFLDYTQDLVVQFNKIETWQVKAPEEETSSKGFYDRSNVD